MAEERRLVFDQLVQTTIQRKQPLNITTGIVRNRTETLRQAKKSKPFNSGIFKSRTMISGKG
jgi:hypothetical protein